MKRDLLERLQDHSFCKIQPSKIHGVGVFSIKDIPSETYPWISNGIRVMDPFTVVSNNKLKKLDKCIKELLYSYNLKSGHGLYLSPYELEIFHITNFLNHSKEPNLKLVLDDKGVSSPVPYVTIKNIKAGEELTVDYENDLKDSEYEYGYQS